MNVASIRKPREGQGRTHYAPPPNVRVRELRDLIAWSGRDAMHDAQLTLLTGRRDDPTVDLFLAGDPELLRAPSVSVVGTREVSEEGRRRASRLARELAAEGIVVTSGLAKGVDTAALTAAIEAGGR